jgi:hypothetical protein
LHALTLSSALPFRILSTSSGRYAICGESWTVRTEASRARGPPSSADSQVGEARRPRCRFVTEATSSGGSISGVKRTIRIRAIHNRTRPPVPVHVSHVEGAILTIEPGQTLTGSWLVEYDTDEHPELYNIADVNEWWFTDSPDVFAWGSGNVPRFRPLPGAEHGRGGAPACPHNIRGLDRPVRRGRLLGLILGGLTSTP